MAKSTKGRKSVIDSDDVYKILEHNKLDLFNGSVLKPYTNEVWTTITQQLGNKLSSKTLYISVYQDRHNFQTKLKKLLNIFTADNKIISENESSDDKTDNEENSNDGKDEMAKFDLIIPYQKYLEFEPITVPYKRKEKRRMYNILKQNTWSDIINDALLDKYNLPCNFIYKRAKVSSDITRSKYFIEFQATCKDKGCKLFGWIKQQPEPGQPLFINILAKDTRGQELQHVTKRPLKGTKRQLIGKQLSTDLASNWRRNNTSKMEFGQISPPNLYNKEILRKTKQEFKDKNFMIIETCPIKSLIEFKNNSQFSGSIHSIGIDPILVHYWSTHQLIIYKDVTKNYCRLSIDATGGLVKRVKRSSLNLISSHIFLYEAVVSTDYGQISVSQMISERQDTLTIYNWLARWLKSGIKIPNETVCDYSTALLGAITRAFCNGSTLRSYAETCFKILMGNEKLLPKCYVRVDVAHIIKMLCRNKNLAGIKNYQLKQFYIRGLRLLIISCKIDEFKEILIALLTTMISETNGYDECLDITPSEASKNLILQLIKGHKFDEIKDEKEEHTINENEYDCNSDEEEDMPEGIGEFLREIEQISYNNSKVIGTSLSGYWAPKLVKDVLRICKDFPLWTSLMKPSHNSIYAISTSASVEGDFSELKRKILRYEILPMTADRFVIKHLKAIENNAILFRSKQLRNTDFKMKNTENIHEDKDIIMNTQAENVKKQPFIEKLDVSSDSDVSEGTKEINSFDNWRGLGETNEIRVNLNKKIIRKKKPRLTTYMDPVPEIEHILTKKYTRSNLNSLLVNGNMKTPLKILKQRYLLHNTCPFDSVAAIVTMAYIDNTTYKNFIDSTKNDFLLFCKDLAINGCSKTIYLKRLHILKNIFNELDGITNVKLIDARCNVTFIILKLLNNAPSAIEKIRCSNKMCNDAEKSLPSPTIILRYNKGFKNMNIDLNNYIQPMTYPCTKDKCNGILTSTRFIQDHLFIETEIFADSRTFSLNEFPDELCINDNRFVFYGVVSYGFDHYVAIIKRMHGNWEIHNDLQKKIIKSKEMCTKVNPHLAIYIKK